MDRLSPEARSKRMSLVRSRDTKPEMLVRRLTHSLGFRYRLHVRSLPGTPDMVFSGLKAVILVNGCFWHQHRCPLGARMPKSRVDFWRAKLEANRKRDFRTISALRKLGWSVLVVWECQTASSRLTSLEARIGKFLGRRRRGGG